MKCMISVCCMLLMMNIAGAGIINVPGNTAHTIQEGIDLAETGDTVLVAEGRYFETIRINGKNITVASHFLTTGLPYYIDNTVIDGSRPEDPDKASTVRFSNCSDTAATLTGFTVTKGAGTLFNVEDVGPYRAGGGVCVENSHARLLHNRIFNNVVVDDNYAGGAGVLAVNTDEKKSDFLVVLRNNVIEQNSIKARKRAVGAGIEVLINAVLEDNLIRNNVSHAVQERALGAGVTAFTLENEPERMIVMHNNRILGNTAHSEERYAFGAGVLIAGCRVEITENEICSNLLKAGTEGHGAGMDLELMTDKSLVARNTIAYNICEEGVGFGGGIRTWQGKNVLIQNNLIHHNEASFGGGFCAYYLSRPVLFNNTIVYNKASIRAAGIYVYNKSRPLVANSIIWNPGSAKNEIYLSRSDINLTNSLVRESKWANIDNMVIDMDPSFLDESYQLTEKSPCIGLGTDKIEIENTVFCAPQMDFYCNKRPCDVDGNIDIGAFETEYCCKMYPMASRLASTYLPPDEKAFHVSAQIWNPYGNKVTVDARITSAATGSERDFGIYDDGKHKDRSANDHIFGGYIPAPDHEDIFSLSILIKDLETEEVLHFRDKKSFTTAGPVVLDHYVSQSAEHSIKPGKRYYFRFHLMNAGKELALKDISAQLTSLDEDYVTILSTVPVRYGDMDPGSIKQGYTGFYLYFTEKYDGRAISLRLDISSEDQLYWSQQVSFVATGMDSERPDVPQVFRLHQNYPNPFNPNTHIRYELAEPCKLDLSVYNTAGKKIATIFRGEQTGGHYEIEWNAADLASGVYYCLLEAQGRSGIHRRVQKMVLVR